MITTQYIEGTDSYGFTQWTQGSESSRLVVDLEAAKIGSKRVKKTVENQDKPETNENLDTLPPEPTITIYG